MRILLADDQAKVRFALRVLLERQPGFHVVGEATDADDLLDQTEADCPDVLLLAWELPGMPVDRLLTALHKCCPDVMVIALSGRLEARRASLCAGAHAFVSKGEPPEHLLDTICDCASNLPTQGAVQEPCEDRPAQKVGPGIDGQP